jgi:hypothetical protein
MQMQTSGPTLQPPNRSLKQRVFLAAVLCLALFGCASSGHASLTVLVGEPFGSFGTMMPNGHSSIYLDRICADGPLAIRMCQPGEPPGVVIARYDHIGPYDWIATPILQFLYATDSPNQALPFATPESVAALRDTYRHRFLTASFPDSVAKDKPYGEWWETAGMAYVRRFWGYQIATTPAQDERFVAAMNARPNTHIYGVTHANCADLSADLVNLYFPGTVKRDHIADFGIMSPKQVARSVYRYGRTHPEANLHILEIPQVPGSLRRSRPVRGGAEGFLKTKRYVATLSILQPELVVGMLAAYLDHGRWKIARPAQILSPETFEQPPNLLAANQ